MIDNITIFFIFIISTFFLSNSFAFNLVGTWRLQAIEHQLGNKKWEPDCNSPTGLLIYTKEGYMAVGLNCMQEKNPKIASFKKQDITFYTGTYSLKNNIIFHHILNSSSPNLYGRTVKRNLQILNDNEIILLLENKDKNPVRIIWKKTL